ncbi:MAG: rRNA maturation RNase YbeY [Paludibacteraceae bacterium]|nr:rRNA maturation RNase YbeY [Paludibacteraceae bacterium]
MIVFDSYQLDRQTMPALIREERSRVEKWLRKVAAGYGFQVGDLHYLFCTDEEELSVNRQFLGHDYYTDVITFDYSTPATLSGDIFISLDTVRSNAEEVGTDFDSELRRILVHGLLHLTGQGDKTPETKAQMTEKENRALAGY